MNKRYNSRSDPCVEGALGVSWPRRSSVHPGTTLRCTPIARGLRSVAKWGWGYEPHSKSHAAQGRAVAHLLLVEDQRRPGTPISNHLPNVSTSLLRRESRPRTSTILRHIFLLSPLPRTTNNLRQSSPSTEQAMVVAAKARLQNRTQQDSRSIAKPGISPLLLRHRTNDGNHGQSSPTKQSQSQSRPKLAYQTTNTMTMGLGLKGPSTRIALSFAFTDFVRRER